MPVTNDVCIDYGNVSLSERRITILKAMIKIFVYVDQLVNVPFLLNRKGF